MSGNRGVLLGGLGAAVAGALIGVVAMHQMDRSDPAETGAIVRSYILDHPEIIPEAMDRLQAKQSAALISTHRDAIEKPFAGAVQGNPKGDVTLVEYFDYACGYCRASVGDVDKLVAGDPGLRVVYKELPILSDWSAGAAKLSLAAAQAGKFAAFHHALYGEGPPTEGKAEEVAGKLGIDAGAAASPAIAHEIEGNIQMARTLRMSGTPTFVVGDTVVSGAVGYQALKDAIDKTRAARKT